MNIGKKILSALVELPEEERAPSVAAITNVDEQTKFVEAQPDIEKFRKHFDALISGANRPGPDYFEFSRMIAAMRAISEESARYGVAFAGLAAQGLDKAVLLESAQHYLAVLDEDAEQFRTTLDEALQEKVQARRQELESNSRRIGELSQEIARLQERNTVLGGEIREEGSKLESNGIAYNIVLQEEQARIRQDIERISKHIS
jgi:hypothetical protein